jgi:fatty-acid desaturase
MSLLRIVTTYDSLMLREFLIYVRVAGGNGSMTSIAPSFSILRHSPLLRPSVQFVGSVQILTALITIYALFSDAAWEWWLLALFGYFVYGCIGLSVGFHRYYAHRSFVAPRWAQILFTLAGALGCSGSPSSWAVMHRQHHRYADQEGDPHSPKLRGLGVMLIHNYAPKNRRWEMRREFRRDPFQRWVHRNYIFLVVGFAGALLLIDWHLFVFGWAVPVAIKLWISGLTIYVTHRFGYANFPAADDSRNVWWLGILAWGEGWHNNHHAKPGRWNFGGHRWWELDVGAWVVRLVTLGMPKPSRLPATRKAA